MDLLRRQLLAASALAALGGALPARAQARPRVVIVGAGFGGAACARYLRKWSPQCHITLVEPRREFVSCPLSNLVVGGLMNLEDITFPYRHLAQEVDRFVADRVVAVEPDRNRVRTAGGETLAYDRLVLAGGVELRFDQIQGYDAEAQKTVKHAWQAGPEQTGVLRRQLQAMPDGGVLVIAIPAAPLRCPPAPYERTCMAAHYFKQAKPRSKIIVLDGNPDIASKKALFLETWTRHYGYGADRSLIEYRPNNVVTGLELKDMKVTSEFDEAKGDVINLIPPMRAAAVTALAGTRTGEGGTWCPVDYRSLESTETPRVHILGDAISSNLSKAAALANTSGKLCAYALTEIFAGRQPDPLPTLASTCYSAGTGKTAFHVASVFRYNPASGLMEVQPGGGVSEHPSEADFKNLHGWARNIWADTLGLPEKYFPNARK